MSKIVYYQRYQDWESESQRKIPKSAVKGKATIKETQEISHRESSTDGCRWTGRNLNGFVHLKGIPGCRQSINNGTDVGKARSLVWGTGFMVEGGHYDLRPNHNSLDSQNVDSVA